MSSCVCIRAAFLAFATSVSRCRVLSFGIESVALCTCSDPPPPPLQMSRSSSVVPLVSRRRGWLGRHCPAKCRTSLPTYTTTSCAALSFSLGSLSAWLVCTSPPPRRDFHFFLSCNLLFSEFSYLDPQDFRGSGGIERAGISVRRYPPEPHFLSLSHSRTVFHTRAVFHDLHFVRKMICILCVLSSKSTHIVFQHDGLFALKLMQMSLFELARARLATCSVVV